MEKSPKNVRMNQLRWPLNNVKGFSKISKPTGREGTYHLQFDFLELFLPNSKEISAVLFLTEKEDYSR